MTLVLAHGLDEMAAKLPPSIAATVQKDDPAEVGVSVASVLVDQFRRCDRFLFNFADEAAVRLYIAVCEYPRDNAQKVFDAIEAAGMSYPEKFLFCHFFTDFADRVFLPPTMGGEDTLPLASGYLSELSIDRVIVEVVSFIVQFASVEARQEFEMSLQAP